MIKKRLFIVLLIVILTGCAPQFPSKNNELEKTTTQNPGTTTIPDYNISDDYYKVMLQPSFKPSQSRGLVVENLHTRLDTDEFELGLIRLATKTFSTKEYLFQEGQFLTKKTARSWLSRKMTSTQLVKNKLKPADNIGLNPILADETTGTAEARNAKSPIYLASIIEHDYYLIKKDKKAEFAGIAIGLALNSVHYYKTEQDYPREEKIPQAEIVKQGKQIAAQVVSYLRQIQGLKTVPITIGLFQQQPKSSISSGHFFASTDVDKSSNSLNDWSPVNEVYYVFPSDETKTMDDAIAFNNFKTSIVNFFPNYTSIVGHAYYVDNQMQRLKIDISMQFYGKSEVIAFTQLVTGLVVKKLPDSTHIEVSISSVRGSESLIVKDPESDSPFVHVY